MISQQQHDALMQGPDSKAVHQRTQSGKTFTYMAQQAVRTELIRVFGFDGWSGEIVDSELLMHTKNEQDRWVAAWRVRYRLTVHWQSEYPTVSTWVEEAVASAFGSSATDTLDQALKSAASDAMKRCAMNLGSRFGLSLYFDGYQGEVVRSTPQTEKPSIAPALADALPTPEAPEGDPPRPDLNTPQGVAEEIERLKGQASA